jgi:hypothetical protein
MLAGLGCHRHLIDIQQQNKTYMLHDAFLQQHSSNDLLCTDLVMKHQAYRSYKGTQGSWSALLCAQLVAGHLYSGVDSTKCMEYECRLTGLVFSHE